MIQAKDLRIGNLYKGASRGNIETATGQTIAQIEEGKLNALPIELTPETLVAAGFVKYKDANIHEIIFEGRFKIILFEGQGELHYVNNDGEFSDLFIPIPTPIRYLHQLQNLYHSLTGEELKIELPTTGKE